MKIKNTEKWRKMSMALITCPECGKQYSDHAPTCPECGCPTSTESTESSGICCPRCGSTDISFQREQTVSIGGSLHSLKGKSGRHGLIYWLFFGWWIWIFKIMWEMLKICFTGGLSLFFRKKKAPAASGKTITASKSINRTMAVCQKCGKTWKVKG